MIGAGLAIVLSGFPRRSETFALAELLALDAAGMVGAIFATKPGESAASQPGTEQVAGRVQILDGDPAAQARSAAAWLHGKQLAGVHAYFAHTPAETAEHLAIRLGVPFGFSVHARDARKAGHATLVARARRAACVIACNGDVAREFDGIGANVHLVPHGVDLGRFSSSAAAPGTTLNLLAVGRLVEKKGFDVLLSAAARLRAPWTLRVVGDGPDRARLEARAAALGLADRIRFSGAITHEHLPGAYREAHVVVVPSVVDRSGDRDGLPNVVLEAMASGRAIVASDVGAIASAVRHADTGLLVPARDEAALASALDYLAADAALRAALGTRARRAVERDFDLHCCTRRLTAVLREAYA